MFIPKKGSGSSLLFTCAATTVVGTSACIQSLALNSGLEIASPVAVTFAVDCNAHPSCNGSDRAGAAWKLGCAAATASRKNGITSLNIFMKMSFTNPRYYRRKAGAPPGAPYVDNTFINSIQ